ncbi:hypothetical protein pb186bvf_019592 [Paramecium bursaria]
MISEHTQKIIDQIKRGEQNSAALEIQKRLKKQVNINEQYQLLGLLGLVNLQNGEPGDAAKTLQDALKQNLDKGVYFFLTNLAKELDDIKPTLEAFQKYQSPTDLTDIYNLQIQNHDFADASNTSLKLYKQDNNPSQFFEYVFLQTFKPQMGGQLMPNFFDKCEKIIEKDVKLKEQLMKLRLTYYKYTKNVDKVLEIVRNNDLTKYQQDCDIQLWVYQQNQSNYEECVEAFMKVFRTHLDEKNFINNFECQLNLINQFMTQGIQLEQQNQLFQVLPKEQLINHIYNSCLQALKLSNSVQIKKSLILTCLRILNSQQLSDFVQEQIKQLSIEYFKIQGDKYSFNAELFKAINNHQLHQEIFNELQQLKLVPKSHESDIIRKINITKLQLLLKQDEQSFKSLLEQYFSYPIPESVEKGERIIQDEFLIMALDLIYDTNSIDKMIQGLSLLQIGLKRSPYNYDLQMRQIIFYSQLGLFDNLIDAVTRLDIKSVQFDTVGFNFISTYLEFGGAANQFEKKIVSALSFYLENLRDSKKNIMTCLRQQSYEQFEQFYQFEDWIKNSYIKLLYQLGKLKHIDNDNKKQSSVKWFINHIKQQLQKQLTYSVNEQFYQSFFIRDFESSKHHKFINYLGIYANPKSLQDEVNDIELITHLNNFIDDPTQVEPFTQFIQQQRQIIQQLDVRNPLNVGIPLIPSYLHKYNQFIELERSLKFDIADFILKIKQLKGTSELKTIQPVSVEKFQQLIEFIKSEQIEKSIPLQLYRLIYRLTKQLVPYVFILQKIPSEVKTLFLKAIKQKQDLKDQFSALQQATNQNVQQIVGLVKAQLQETKQFLKSLEFQDIVSKNTLIDEDHFSKELATQFGFLNIQYISLIEDSIQEEMRMEILQESKPKKILKLYELTEDEIGINLQQVNQWSSDNQEIYSQIQENGFADFICNKEYLQETYTNLLFDSEGVDTMDSGLVFFKNLKLLRLNNNQIRCVQNLPKSLLELHAFYNPISSFNLIRHNLQYLGLGYCQVNDDAIQNLAKFLPQLLALDLTYNQLSDLEYSVEGLKKLTNLKCLCLNMFPYIIDNLINLKYFDEQKFVDLKNKLLQAEQEKQQRIQEALQKQQAELEAQQKALADKNKKGGKPAPAPAKQVIEVAKVEDIPVQVEQKITDPRSFKLIFKIQTLENLEGILLDKTQYPQIEPQPNLFQSRYSAQIQIFGDDYKTKEVLYETGTVENDIGRLDFEYINELSVQPSVEKRDFIQHGFLITVFVEEPKMNEEGEKKPVLNGDIPEQDSRILGICTIKPDWLRGQNRLIQKKYKLFRQEIVNSAELWYPQEEERQKIDSNMENIKKEIEEEELKKKQFIQQMEARKEQLKGKGKDNKKKDDKKAGKKGKDDVQQKVVGVLDWELDNRQYVYVTDKIIHRSLQPVLAVSIELC